MSGDMMGAAPTVRVLVCGSIDRRDDGAAIWAAAAVVNGRHADALLDVRRCGQLDIDDVLGAGDVPIVIVDAAIGVPPGTVVTIPFNELIDRPSGPAPQSSHALPIAQVLGIARELGGADVRGVFVGIGGADFGYGRQLSNDVKAALPEFVLALSAAVTDAARTAGTRS